MEYSLGFAFTENRREVLLIRKISPPWQYKRFNGVGGKVEYEESMLNCMIREFREETRIITKDWKYKGMMNSNTWAVQIFTIFLPKEILLKAKGQGSEKVHLFSVDFLPPSILSNLKWLIPFCLDQGEPASQHLPGLLRITYDKM